MTSHETKQCLCVASGRRCCSARSTYFYRAMLSSADSFIGSPSRTHTITTTNTSCNHHLLLLQHNNTQAVIQRTQHTCRTRTFIHLDKAEHNAQIAAHRIKNKQTNKQAAITLQVCPPKTSTSAITCFYFHSHPIITVVVASNTQT